MGSDTTPIAVEVRRQVDAWLGGDPSPAHISPMLFADDEVGKFFFEVHPVISERLHAFTVASALCAGAPRPATIDGRRLEILRDAPLDVQAVYFCAATHEPQILLAPGQSGTREWNVVLGSERGVLHQRSEDELLEIMIRADELAESWHLSLHTGRAQLAFPTWPDRSLEARWNRGDEVSTVFGLEDRQQRLVKRSWWMVIVDEILGLEDDPDFDRTLLERGIPQDSSPAIRRLWGILSAQLDARLFDQLREL